MSRIRVVGVGPGGINSITAEAAEAIKEAEVIIGGNRHLDTFAYKNQEKFAIGSNLDEVISFINSRKNKIIVVLATGDPGFFGVLKYLNKFFNKEEIQVIPGISSVQFAFARLSMSWEDAVFLSAHGRPMEKLEKLIKDSAKTAILTGNHNSPKKIFELLEHTDKKQVYLCFDLTLSTESICMIKSGDKYPKELEGKHNCVMVIINE
ncbi:MAG: precorrin-6y C5,15-methyltransferase (decarboxylating) subunit CbiE [Peptococcaceae bacterium]|nr:precorrin-6y C5,15-methyltransferase (decarboxylating) subunit CbiE [Peptococcaceae bacterium]